MTGKVAKWWLPDEVAFVEELPHTATGKVHKLKLREEFAGLYIRVLISGVGAVDSAMYQQTALS